MLESEKTFVYARSFIFNQAFPKMCSTIIGVQKAVCEYNGSENLLAKENFEKAIKPLIFIQFKLLTLSQRFGDELEVSLAPDSAESVKKFNEKELWVAYLALLLNPASPLKLNKERLKTLFIQAMSFFDLLFQSISFYSESAVAEKPAHYSEQMQLMKQVYALARLYTKLKVNRNLFANIDNEIANVCYDIIYTKKRRIVAPEALVDQADRLCRNLGFFLLYNKTVKMLDLSGCALNSESVQKLLPAIATSKNSLEDLRLEKCGLDDVVFNDILKAIAKKGRKKDSAKIITLIVNDNDLSATSADLLASTAGLTLKTLTISFYTGFREACEFLYAFAKTNVVERINLPQKHLLNQSEVQMQLALEYRREQGRIR